MAPRAEFLLIGGGLASVTAAETLRAEGAEGSIAILSAEDVPPYHRPPLSKHFLTADLPPDRLLIQPERFYHDNAIELRLGARAVSVAPRERMVTTDGGDRFGYGKLLIATGGGARPLAVPGAGLAGVHGLRSLADAQAIRRAAASARTAVVVGGSFMGLELAASLAQMGLAVTVLERGAALMPKLHAAELSDFFAGACAAHGVAAVLGATVAAIEGDERVRAVVSAAGRRWPCDLVVLGIGIAPELGFLAGSGIAFEDGILADERLRTNVADVFAAGDVANFIDPVFGRRRRIEHWDNAVKQGRLAARNMLGRNLPYDEVSYFFSDVFEVSFDMLGAPEEGEERVARGALERRSFGLFYLRNELMRAMFALGRPAEEIRAAEGLIRYRVNVAALKPRLAADDDTLADVPAQTVLILQGGGALGAFECGVVRALEEATIVPDIVAGVSIGAFNGAIVASHPGAAAAALEAFWSELAVATPDLYVPDLTRAVASWQIMMLGVPRFFTPRWLGDPGALAGMASGWTSLYDTAPVRALIRKYVDFTRLRTSPVRLLVSAVDVETAELQIFDSYADDLTEDHILASGSLPPGFSWTAIGAKHYWDGALISNSPLDMVIERCGPGGKRVFIVDLFAGKKPLPGNLVEVMARRDEILYAERVRNDLRTRQLASDFGKLVEEVMALLGEADATRIRHRPRYIQLMGGAAPMTITRIVRDGGADEVASRDYDFSQPAIRRNQEQGYAQAQAALAG